MKTRLSFAFIALVFLGACSNGGGGHSNTNAPLPNTNPNGPTTTISTEQLSYELSLNGCSTGKHTFNSKKEYCDALLTDALNNNCARELRIENYNRNCSGIQVTSPGTLPSVYNARCVVNGMDLKDRTFLQNLNPFNPQRRQSFRNISWDGQRQKSYDIVFMAADGYGKSNYVMTPANQAGFAQGDIQIQQNRNMDNFSARSGLGSPIRLLVTNYKTQKEVEAVCISNASFKRPKVDMRRVRCEYRNRELILDWDTRSALQKEVFKNRSGASLVIRLKPAMGGQDERIEVEALELDIDKTLKAEASLNEGLEIRYQGRLSRTDFSLRCAPASN